MPPICRVHPPRQLLRSRPPTGFPGSALGSPPTGGGRKVTNCRDRTVAPNDCARSAPTASAALVSSLAVRIPVQVRPRWEPLPSPEFNTPAGHARLFRLRELPLCVPWLCSTWPHRPAASHLNAYSRQIGEDRLIEYIASDAVAFRFVPVRPSYLLLTEPIGTAPFLLPWGGAPHSLARGHQRLAGEFVLSFFLSGNPAAAPIDGSAGGLAAGPTPHARFPTPFHHALRFLCVRGTPASGTFAKPGVLSSSNRPETLGSPALEAARCILVLDAQ